MIQLSDECDTLINAGNIDLVSRLSRQIPHSNPPVKEYFLDLYLHRRDNPVRIIYGDGEDGLARMNNDCAWLLALDKHP